MDRTASMISESARALGKTILVVEDEERLVRLLRLWLTRDGYRMSVARDGSEAVRLFHTVRPDLVILDIALPSATGWDVCQNIRRTSDVPILMLTARSEESDKIKGFALGTDDYVTKPFSFPELLARIDALLRRACRTHMALAARRYVDGPLVIDLDARQVFLHSLPIALTRTEYQLLAFLADNAGRLLTHREILTHVWGPEFGDDVDYVRVYVRAIRHKIEPDPAHPRFLLTEHGAGYRLHRPAEPTA